MSLEDETEVEVTEETENEETEVEDTAENDNSEEDSNQDVEEETIIQLGDDEPEKEASTPLLKDLRRRLKEKSRRVKELEARAEGEEPKPSEKPRLESFDYDADKFEAAYDKWVEEKRAADNQKSQAEKAKNAQQETYQSKLNGYNERKAKMTVKDFDEMEAIAMSALSDVQQGLIVSATKSSEALIYALGSYPEKLAALAAITDPVEFVAESVRMEMTMKTTTRKKPAPERKLKPGSAPLSGGKDRQLDKLEEEAERTGDRTQVLAYKRNLRQAS